MDDVPRRTLKQIIARYGQEVCRTPRRCEGLLRDLCGEYKREIFVLITALEAGVPDDLRALHGKLPEEVMLAQVTAGFQDGVALTQDAARWAVVAWAEALGLISEGVASAASSPASPTSGYQLAHTLTGHQGAVHGVAFSHDGRRLITVGADSSARVWDVAQGREIQRLSHRTGILTAVALSPDGKSVALGSGDTGVYLWVPREKKLQRLRGHQGAVTGVTFLAAGEQLASCGRDGTVRLWDRAQGRAARTLTGGGEALLDVASGNGGRLLAAAGGWSRAVHLWDLETREELHTMAGHVGKVTCVAFHPQGRWLASAGWDERVYLWDVGRGREQRHMRVASDEASMVLALAVAPAGRILATGGWDGVVRIWDTVLTRQTEALAGRAEPAARVLAVAFSPGGRWLATADEAGVVSTWKVRH